MPEFAHAEVPVEHPALAIVAAAPAAVEHTPFMPGPVASQAPVAGTPPLESIRQHLAAAEAVIAEEAARQAAIGSKVPTLDDVHELLNRIQAGK